MRIGLYGVPTAGKTYILKKIDFIPVHVGSDLLKDYDKDFRNKDESEKEIIRKEVAKRMMSEDTFIMDGHYKFGDTIAFTEEEGQMYDVYIYLYVRPDVWKDRLKESVKKSDKNSKYISYDIEKWQMDEIKALSQYCHDNNKDFYVVDCPSEGCVKDVSIVIDFIRSIVFEGYSCVDYAKECADKILDKNSSDIVVLCDGDKTLVTEDTSKAVLDYSPDIYDNNFYTGFQSWLQYREFERYKDFDILNIPVHFRKEIIRNFLCSDIFILTSGYDRIWKFIANVLNCVAFCGNKMCADTKFFITKFLQRAGKKVIAYGDSMNDYFMLKQADKAYLVRKEDGSFSRSLGNIDIGGFDYV